MMSRLVPALLVAVLLSACASRIEGVFTPVTTTVPGASRVDMLVTTTRAAAEDPAVLFTGERGSDVAVADIGVSIPPDSARQVGEVQFPTSLPGNPATEFVVYRSERINMNIGQARLRSRLARHQGRVLLFVHGYNNRFDDAVFRFAQFVHDSAAPAAPVMFTWPSRGRTLAYPYDRESANYSRDALEAVIRGLIEERSVRDITILAHSMGNWPAVEALRQIALRDRVLSPKIRNVILAAPDIDRDVFGTQIARLGPRRPRITLMVSQDDVALNVARRVWGGERLGAADPSVEPTRSLLARNHIEVLDLTALKAGDSLNHGKFAQAPEVVQFIGRRLIAGQALGDARTSLGEGIATLATNVGAAAGAVISAPVAIIDPQSREDLGERLSTILDRRR